MIVRTSSCRRTSAACFMPGMVGGREQEAEAGLVEQRRAPLRRKVDLRAERFEHVGRAAARADAAVAVLGDRQSAGRRDEGRRGRDVDQPRAVAAGAAAIGEQIVGPVERHARRRETRARRRSFPRRSRPSSAGRSAFRRSRRARAGRAPAARTDARHPRSAGLRRSSSLGSGLGTGCDGSDRRHAAAAGREEGQQLVHGFHLKQKSPPDGGRAVDDRVV